jgi:import inner membrane translocase subunit TIM10
LNQKHNITDLAMEIGVKQESFRIEVLMKNLQSMCFNECCADLSGEELSTVEVNCLDRCSWKYLTVDRMLTTTLDRRAGGAERKKKG